MVGWKTSIHIELKYAETLPPSSSSLSSKKIWVISPTIEQVCDNQSAIIVTWKDKNISVFEKTKPDANVSKLARTSITTIQCYYKVKAFWIRGHSEKAPPTHLRKSSASERKVYRGKPKQTCLQT
jgi:hypothetical protein